MRFKPFGRYEFNDTGRKRATYFRANACDIHPRSDKTP